MKSSIIRSCSTTSTAVSGVASSLMNLLTAILCLMSKYDVGSSKMYRFALRRTVAAIAIRCSSPPDICVTSLSSTSRRPSLSTISLNFPVSSVFLRRSPTVPFIVCAMSSTCCGLYATFIFPSRRASK